MVRTPTERYRRLQRLRRLLGEQRRFAEGQFIHAKDMDAVNKIKGRVEGMIGLELIATQHEREEADAAERATQRERAHAGLSAVR